MLLSDRMKAVVGLVQPCRSIADIGCDHGYVAIELVQNNLCQHVIAMDVHKGPLERARDNIKVYKMQDFIETRLSDGTEALYKNEAEGIVCAGMGGKLTISILEQGRELVREMKQIILQPQSEINEVRAYLRKNGFVIEKEDMIYEDEKYYPMMRVLPKTSYEIPFESSKISKEEQERFVRVQDTYGHYLLKMSHPILKKYLQAQKKKLETIQRNLIKQKQSTQRQQERISQLEDQLGDIVFCLYYYFDCVHYTSGRKD